MVYRVFTIFLMLPCLQEVTKPIVLIDSLGFSTEIIVASENKRRGHIFVSKLYLICFVIALVKTSITRMKNRNDNILSYSQLY